MSLAPLFGIVIYPTAGHPAEQFRLAKLADDNDLDLLTMPDHPYQGAFFDTWTLLAALALATKRLHFTANVTSLPLRLPSMLAKQAATLDILTGGRVEMSLGAGMAWDGIEAYGGPRRTPAEAYTAFEDAVHILRGLWDSPNRSFSYSGKVYSVAGAQGGPAPAHRIPIWTGAFGPKMMRLTGRLADGLLVTSPVNPPQRLLEINALIDEGAAAAGRSAEAIRRGYNITGTIASGQNNSGDFGKSIEGTASYWVDQLLRLYSDYRQDTFVLVAKGDVGQQIEMFAKEVVPAVKERLGASEKSPAFQSPAALPLSSPPR
jgi:alkanesulfonate monooxygenase SsuD/methylene tetrahydromethanopterin reductase-like flavin-dependent oxidoreductase (luciferase family)